MNHGCTMNQTRPKAIEYLTIFLVLESADVATGSESFALPNFSSPIERRWWKGREWISAAPRPCQLSLGRWRLSREMSRLG